MLSPMEVQYLVALCCLRKNPEAVDLTIGDMVFDEAAGKHRDVDVTVLLEDGPGIVRAFKAFEVKREKRPLDLEDLDALCAKLDDMPKVTHKAVVSASGYSESAVRKAAKHGVEAYALGPWSKGISETFPQLRMDGTPETHFKGRNSLLVWAQPPKVNHAVSPDDEGLNLGNGTPTYQANGAPHPLFGSMGDYVDRLKQRATAALFNVEPAISKRQTLPDISSQKPDTMTFSPAWPACYALNVASDRVFVKASEGLANVVSIELSGELQWASWIWTPEFHLMTRVTDNMVFAGAIVAPSVHQGEFLGIVFVPESRTLGVHRFALTDKQKRMIHGLKLLREQGSPASSMLPPPSVITIRSRMNKPGLNE